jgi:PilZ domain-containing protein
LTLHAFKVIVSEVAHFAKGIFLVDSPKQNIPGTAVLVERSEGVRRWERFTVDIRMKASFKRNGMPLTVFGRGSDVSQGGMAAYIPSELQVGASVDLELSLPYVGGEQPIRIIANVRNRNGFRYGLEYIALSESDKARLLNSLRALALTR